MMIRKSVIQRIQQMVRNNEHGEAMRLAAQCLGRADLVEKFARINRRQLQLGSLSPKLYEERYATYQEMLKFAKSALCRAAYRQLYSAL